MRSYRWVIIALAFLAIIINYLDRTALSYAIHPLQERFNLNNADFGLIASAFGLGYLIMTVGGGVLVDKFGTRKIWSIFAIIWSGACILIGFATGFISLFIYRLILGIAEGPGFPALTRVCADWLPVNERARALAFGLAAVPFASVVGAPLISHLIAFAGWRAMFWILGILGILWGFVWYALFRDKPKDSQYICATELAHIHLEHGADLQKGKTPWRFILFNKTLMINNYAFFAFGYLLFFAITWLPGYLEQTYHLPIKSVGWILILPWLTATISILLGGVISDKLWKKTKNIRTSRSHIIWICQILSVICFIPVILSPSLTVSIIGISLGVGFGLMPNAAFYAINVDLAFDKAATSLGLMDAFFALAGIIAPALTGWLTHFSGNFSSAFILMMLLTLSSSLLIVIYQK